jgi:hypothetical protein
MGVIARAILHAGVHVFRSVVPVRISHGLHQPTERDENSYGLLVTLVSGLQTIVPVDLLCVGSRSGITVQREDTSHLRLWDKEKKHVHDNATKVSSGPILQCVDVELQPNDESNAQPQPRWHPRRYATVWWLAPALNTVLDEIVDPPLSPSKHTWKTKVQRETIFNCEL